MPESITEDKRTRKAWTIHENNQKTYSCEYVFKLQFNYCPLVWMYCNRSLNTKTNRKHERCLRMVYNDKKTNFNELLVKDSSVSIHHQNLQKLAVEMFKVSRGLSPEIVNGLFQFLVVQKALNFLGRRYGH